MKYSFFVLVNNKEIFDNNIGRFFDENTSKIANLICDDNSSSRYASIREWLNEKLSFIYSNEKLFENNFIFFVHQDVYSSPSLFYYFDRFISMINLDELGLIGFAGKNSSNKSFGFMLDSGLFWFTGGYSPAEVETVDEFCFVIPADVLIRHHIFLSNIAGWHAYAAEFSIVMKTKDLKTFYFPIYTEHNSVRTNNVGLFDTHKKLFQKYKLSIVTLVGDIKNFNWGDKVKRHFQEIYYSKIKFRFRNNNILRFVFNILDMLRPNSMGFRRLDYLLSKGQSNFYYFDNVALKIEDFIIDKPPLKINFKHIRQYTEISDDTNMGQNIFILGYRGRINGFKYIRRLDINYKVL
jgi:hypothetical protein